MAIKGYNIKRKGNNRRGVCATFMGMQHSNTQHIIGNG